MSASIKNNKKSSSSAIAANGTSRLRAIIQRRYSKISLSSSPSSSVAASAALLTSNCDGVFSSSSSVNEVELTIKTNVTTTAAHSQAGGKKSSLRLAKASPSASASVMFPTFKIMTYPNIMALLTVLVCGLVTVNGLKCYMCGQYNEGVGSITPCLNYSDQYAHLYLKECSKKSEKFCVKYVSELSIVRDCATECAEKEIWETQTYCCPEDGCNGSSTLEASGVAIILPILVYVVKEVLNNIKQRR